MGCLEQYLGPLWQMDKGVEDWKHFHLRSTDVTATAVRDVGAMAELEEHDGRRALESGCIQMDPNIHP